MFTLVFKVLTLVLTLCSTIGFKPGSSPTESVRRSLEPYVRAYDLEKINQALETIKAKGEYPEIGRAVHGDREQVPSLVRSRFQYMNRVIFGKRGVVTLYAADGNFAAPHEAGLKIGFPRDMIPQISGNQTLLDFTLAHSLAHYLYELYIAKHSPAKLSPHDNTSRGTEETASLTGEAAAAHAEIDAIAVAVLLKMGHDVKKLHTVIQRGFSKEKNRMDDAIDMQVNERTVFNAIPDDARPKIRDNYVRFLSFISTFVKLTRS
ncbi:MAG: hypothetical protein ABL958_06300 [Bdellovibrionia bacterium]